MGATAIQELVLHGACCYAFKSLKRKMWSGAWKRRVLTGVWKMQVTVSVKCIERKGVHHVFWPQSQDHIIAILFSPSLEDRSDLKIYRRNLLIPMRMTMALHIMMRIHHKKMLVYKYLLLISSSHWAGESIIASATGWRRRRYGSGHVGCFQFLGLFSIGSWKWYVPIYCPKLSTPTLQSTHISRRWSAATVDSTC